MEYEDKIETHCIVARKSYERYVKSVSEVNLNFFFLLMVEKTCKSFSEVLGSNILIGNEDDDYIHLFQQKIVTTSDTHRNSW